MEMKLDQRPIYFVSSNMHSFVNVLSGTASRRERELKQFIRESTMLGLADELEKIESGKLESSLDNLLYFAARPYFALPAQRPGSRAAHRGGERARRPSHRSPLGGRRRRPDHRPAQDRSSSIDPRLCDPGRSTLDPRASDAIIVNVNYPLGFAAYHILSQVAMATEQIRGIYILGKAATLNGRIGDVMLSDVVFDEHSGNTYWFDNCFSYQDLAPYLVFGAALDNQKAVTVKGTYLQNEGYLDFYYRENFTVVEMEAGPYLNAIYEDSCLERHPSEQAINLRGTSRPRHRSRHHPLRLRHALHPRPNPRRARPVLLRHGLDLRLHHRHPPPHLPENGHAEESSSRVVEQGRCRGLAGQFHR